MSSMVDASFANCPLTKRSYFGYLVRYGDNPIAWRSKLEASVALSTRDSELMAAVHCVRHVLGLRFFLSDLGLLAPGASTVMIDNTASLDGVCNDKNHKDSHYMAYKLAWLRDQVADLLVDLQHIPSKDNQSDLFTKVLPEDQFIKLRDLLMGLVNEIS